MTYISVDMNLGNFFLNSNVEINLCDKRNILIGVDATCVAFFFFFNNAYFTFSITKLLTGINNEQRNTRLNVRRV